MQKYQQITCHRFKTENVRFKQLETVKKHPKSMILFCEMLIL